MKNSILLLASFAGLVACFGEKKEPATDGQVMETTCPADTAPAVEEKKVEATAPTATETPAAEPVKAQ
nr:uncharacterized protein [uncultured bacterium]